MGELTEEDVFPKWIAAMLPKGGRFETFTRREGSDTVLRHFENVGKLGIIAPVVCHGCNHGWMERLESHSRPFLKPMIRGAHTMLDAQAIRTFARWASKTHQMYRYHLNRPPIPAALAAVHAGNVPRATYVLAAAWDGKDSAFGVHNSRQQRIARIHNTENAPADDEVFHAELLTLRIGYLAIQMFEITPYRPEPWSIPMDGVELNYIRAIWPPPRGSIRWPPPLPLDDEKFGAFDYRFRWASLPR